MAEPVLKVENLKKHFPIKRGFISTLKGEPQRYVRAVDGISFEIEKQEVFALVGESGCGKSTTGKLIVKLLEPTEGKIYLEGKDVTNIKTKEEILDYRRRVQIIFQDPFSSMNPRFRIFDILEEPLLIHGIGETKAEREELIYKALEMVKITPPEDYVGRFPHMLSGGQRQRVAIARALILNPTFIVADEPVSMLDVSIRAEILELMKELKEKMGVTYLYITHDLSTARYFADYIAVMYLGRIVEMGPAEKVIDNPLHPYTRALLAAVPEPKPERRNVIKELPIKGEVPNAAEIPPGCRFHPRCIYAQKGLCDVKHPQLVEYEHNHFAECHLVGKY
ncbi:ABC-type dipeptide/oligopeptide transport system, ATPase component [Thermococcus onnurineus NA1]|uniref:ABC-type dipeptide/oligopeptide transport system, ATPase component n=1 Tax=Thermococcus onnurineus (strain NA1) TaxID=523850 RepID=B6YV30_THEON|nr:MULTISPECIES: ABC transporter ATP-binding protein [Thermococcus]ACJ17258.1 ABC-type dipeptide/oligopeptide transport system, ATPase component [Thermococcus onnurineus NA1]NJE46001.1 ABC transporter ATP-binding protein [Thermococcus sp. GR7]NJE78494.1 ABC transporter ATP-binding protein [Thermococcus sp. GR4]NJF22197.1 ABC transporter ATP-binding protein [Thermococcus sp. GR5]